MKDVQILGVDLGKNSCSVVGLDAAGRVLLRRRMRREWSRWRRAAEPITSGAFWLPRDTRCG